MAYESKAGDVSIFKNNTENPKAPQYTGTCIAPDGTTYRISLWVKEGAKGKFFSGRMETPTAPKPVGNSTSFDPFDVPDSDAFSF
jgi:hypothetical protein